MSLFYPAGGLFFFFIISGVSMVLFSSSWFMAWVGMEINLIGFIPWMMKDKSFSVGQAGVQYFVVQSIGSSLFLLGSMVGYSDSWSLWSGVIVFLSLMVKAGSAPFHQWFPSVLEGVSWPCAAVLLSLQKLAPVLMCVNVVDVVSGWLCMGLAILNSYVGSFGGLHQTSIRPLFGYSSISHLGWIIALMVVSPFAASWYLLGHIVLVMSVVGLFLLGDGVKMVMVNNFLFGKGWGVVFSVLVLSMAGLPPFFGFFLKLFALSFLVGSFECVSVGLILVVSSMVSLIYYLNLSVSIFKVVGVGDVVFVGSEGVGLVGWLVLVGGGLSLLSLPVMLIF